MLARLAMCCSEQRRTRQRAGPGLVPLAALAAFAALAALAAATLAVPAAGVPASQAATRPPVEGRVLDAFDPPDQPWGSGNRGVKLAAAPGEAVRSVLGGTVTFSGQVARAGWVTVDHGGGLDTTYGVLGARAVTSGQRVRAGDRLGRVAEGRTRLHWGARIDGDYVDPLMLLERWQVRLVPLAP